MLRTKPRPPKQAAIKVDSMVVALPEPLATSARARTFVRVSLFHPCKAHHSEGRAVRVHTKENAKILAKPLSSMRKLAKRHLTVTAVIGESIEIRDNAIPDEAWQRGRRTRREKLPGRRAET